jgi:outer membrane biosynthesis protein TonB
MKQMELQMAEEITAPATATTEEAVAVKPAPKKAPAKKKPAAKKAAAKKPAAKKVAAKKVAAKKVAAKKPAAKKAAPKAAKKPAAKKATVTATPVFAERAQEASRSAFLASLGFYGRAFDQLQEQLQKLQEQLEARRNKANSLYGELVKRGEKVEADAKNVIDDLDIAAVNIENFANREKLDAQLEKAKARFSELKESVSFKAAA